MANVEFKTWTDKKGTMAAGGYMHVEYTTSTIKVYPMVGSLGGYSKKKAYYLEFIYPGGSIKKKIGKAHAGKTEIQGPWLSFSTYTATFTLKFRGVEVDKKTVTSTLKPSAPSIKTRFANDSRAYVDVYNGAEKGLYVSGVTLQRQDDIATANWEDLTTWAPKTNNGYSYTYTDQTTERGHRYRYRAWASNSNGNSSVVYSAWYYTYPPSVSNVAHVRNSNYQCTVSWQRNGQDVDRELITGFKVERSQSGGAWTTIATVGAGGASAQTVTYIDKKCSPDNYYSYRIKPVNSRGVSIIAYDEGGTEKTYNTPSAPSSIKAVYTTAAGSIRLELKNTTKTATELEIERSLNGGSTWDPLVTLDETTGPVTNYTDNSGVSGDAVMYRARNARSDLPTGDIYSSWAYSNNVNTLSTPEPPTLIMPFNGTPVSLDNQYIRLIWTHNPTDGTPQEAAQIQYRINGIYIATITLESASVYDLTLDPSRFSPNDEVTWRVRTKGAYSEYSEWSEYNNFITLGLPEITFTSPDNGAVIDNLPLTLGWEYNDLSGTLKSLTLTIIKDEKTELELDIPVGTGESGSYSYSLTDFLFANGESYQLQAVAVSSTGLSVSDTINVSIDYEYVRFTNALFMDANFDEDTGEVTLAAMPNVAPTEGEEDVVDANVIQAYLYRNVNGKRVLLDDDIHEGDQLVDRYAPVNVPVKYELLEIADNGMLSLVTMEFTFETPYWYVYWNDRAIKAIWNPNGSLALSRPEKEQIRYSGRKYPVTYDSTAIEEKYSFSGVTDDRETLDAFADFIRDGGQGIWKSADGHCYKADFEYNYSSDYTYNHIRWDISLEVTRIDSEDL